MTVNESATYMGLSREEIKIAIQNGIELPKSKTIVCLVAHDLGDQGYDIDEDQLDTFKLLFEAEEPGRHPPTEIARNLLVEAKHRCGICREIAPLEFHHLIEFSKVKHYDIRHMMAVCPTCHTRCGIGEIDGKAQRQYKQKLIEGTGDATIPVYNSFLDDAGPIRFSWDDIRDLILGLFAHRTGKV